MNRPATGQQQALVIAQIALGVFEAIEATDGLGAPSGVLYAAMMTQGATLNQYQSFMQTLVGPGHIYLQDDCYHITPAGIAFKATLVKLLAKAKQT